MQLKTTTSQYLAPGKVASSKRQADVGEEMKTGNLVHCGWECIFVQPAWKKARGSLKTELAHDPGTPLEGTFPKEMSSFSHRDTPAFSLQHSVQ